MEEAVLEREINLVLNSFHALIAAFCDFRFDRFQGLECVFQLVALFGPGRWCEAVSVRVSEVHVTLVWLYNFLYNRHCCQHFLLLHCVVSDINLY